ncbi:MAG: acyl carrier protein [Pseudomonadota bacterium]
MDGGVEERVADILMDELTLPRLAPDIDLIAAGYLDSLALVDLVFHLEQQFGFQIGLDDLEAENFASIQKIADFVSQNRL